MKYKVIARIFIIMTILLAVFSLNNTVNALDEDTNNLKFKLQVNGEDTNIDDIIYKYDTIFVPMEATFKELYGDDYSNKIKYVSSYKYKKATQTCGEASNNVTPAKINENDITVKIGDFIIADFFITEVTEDNVSKFIKENGQDRKVIDLKIEIEKENGKKYIPIYLISNLKDNSGSTDMSVTVDGTLVYEPAIENTLGVRNVTESNIYRSKDAIKNSNAIHTINIITGKTKKFKCLNTNSITENTEMVDDSLAYQGEEDGALWREEALKRIEKVRKKDVNIKIVDENGKEIKNAFVNLKLKNTEFIHGTNITNEKDEVLGDNYYTYDDNVELFSGNSEYSYLFNEIGALEHLKWLKLALQGKGTNQTEGKPANKDAIKELINKAKEQNLYFRGHYLWWDLFHIAGVDEPEKQYQNVKYQTLIGDPENLTSKTDGNNFTMSYINALYNAVENDGSNKEELITPLIGYKDGYTKEYIESNIDKVVDELINKLIAEFEEIVFDHIESMVTTYPTINEWDCVNELGWNSFFKHYLYDKGLLKDNTFSKGLNAINNGGKIGLEWNEFENQYRKEKDKRSNASVYNLYNYNEENGYDKSNGYSESNDRYLNFINNCFKKAKENNSNAKYILNHNELGTSRMTKQNLIIDVINRMKELNDGVQPIDGIGIQGTVDVFGNWSNKVFLTPMYVNYSINNIVDKTGVNDIAITEFFTIDSNSKANNDIKSSVRGKYVYDTLISYYGNPNVYEFIFYNHIRFDIPKEREAYKAFAKKYFTYDETIEDYNGAINRNLTKGDYVATVIVDGVEKEFEFKVTDDSDNFVFKLGTKANGIINPKTGDNFYTNIIVLLLSLSGLVGVFGYLKKYKLIKNN